MSYSSKLIARSTLTLLTVVLLGCSDSSSSNNQLEPSPEQPVEATPTQQVSNESSAATALTNESFLIMIARDDLIRIDALSGNPR